MTEERPSDGLEERMVFYIRGSSAGAKPSHLIFDEKLAYDRLTEASDNCLEKLVREEKW